MALSSLTDRTQVPDASQITLVLGKAAPAWDELCRRLQERHGPLAEQWHHGGEKTGWTLRLRDRKRAVVYLIPGEGSFLVGLVLGERAARAALAGELPSAVRAAIEQAPAYAEGRGFRLPVRGRRDLPAIVRLVELKLAR